MTTARTANSDLGVTLRSREEVWELTPGSGLPEVPPPSVTPPVNRSADRLDRPLHTLTAEHCGWLLLIAYTLFTRLAVLTIRPLDANEAARALGLIGSYSASPSLPPQPGWVRMLTLGLFAISGASDWCVRLVPALCGLFLIAVAYSMRRYLGRAGALALALLLSLSPAFTYYSRTYAPAVPAALIALATLYAFCSLIDQPSSARAGWLGGAIGLLMASPPDGRVTGLSFALTLLLLGLYRLATRPHPILSIRVWFHRYREFLLITVFTAIVVWLIVQLFAADASSDGSATLAASGNSGSPLNASIRFYLAALTLGEFLIVIAAVAGLAAIASGRLRSELAAAMLLWSLISPCLLIFSLPLEVAYITVFLLPMAIVGALGIEWLHRSAAWPIVRAGFGVLAIVTIYIQILSNFIYYAPDASEASWNRHASLYWSPLSTTLQTRVYCRRAMAGILPKDATVYFGTDAAAIEWYLRELRPVSNPSIASVIVGPPVSTGHASSNPIPAPIVRRFNFAYAMSWPLGWNDLTAGAALRYVFAAEAWASPASAPITITAPLSNQPEP